MREVEHGRQSLVSTTAQPPRAKEMPETILEVLKEWECTWMWKSLRLICDEHWLEDAMIEAGTCHTVTDGAYIKEHLPNVCSAAIILECSGGRGRIIGSFPDRLSQPAPIVASSWA